MARSETSEERRVGRLLTRLLLLMLLVGLLGALMVYLLAANIGVSRETRSRVFVYVEVAAMATLAVGLVHALLGLGEIYGFYQATVDVSDRLLITPFVTPNHAVAVLRTRSA